MIILGTISALVLPVLIASVIRSTGPVFFLMLQYTALRDINPGQRNAAEVLGVVLVVVGNSTEPVHQLYKDRKGKRTAGHVNDANEVELKNMGGAKEGTQPDDP